MRRGEERRQHPLLSQMSLMLVCLTESKYDNEEVKAHLIMKRMEKELFELSQPAENCDKAFVCVCVCVCVCVRERFN